jgi:hypothetical protein
VYPLAGLGTGVASDSFLVTNQSQLFPQASSCGALLVSALAD